MAPCEGMESQRQPWRRKRRNATTPAMAPSVGATRYIHKPSNVHATSAGPSDLAGFIDPPETGLL